MPSTWGRGFPRAESKAEMIAAALAMLDTPPPAVDADLVADFLALGYAHFVIETITVSIRYMNSLDESAFERRVVGRGGGCLRRRWRGSPGKTSDSL